MKTIPPALDQGIYSNCTAAAIRSGLKAAYELDFDVNWLMAINERLSSSIPGVLAALMVHGGLPVGDYSIAPTWTAQAREWAESHRSKLSPVAAKYKVEDHKQITTEDELAEALDTGWYVAFSANCKTRRIDEDGIYRPYNGSDYGLVHAISAWYINPDGTVRILNSWGAGWGDQGQANMLASDILRGNDCWAYWIDALPPETPEEPKKKEGKEMRYTAYIKTVTDGAAVRVRETSATDSTQVGSVKDGSMVLVLSESGTRREICYSKAAEDYMVGWIPASYLIDRPPEEPFTPVTKEVFTYTEDQKGLRLTEHFTVGDFWAYSSHKKIKLDTTLAYILEEFYTKFGVRPLLRNKNLGTDKPYLPHPSAGYRDSANWSGSKTSQHCYGKGLDFYIPGVAAYKLAQFAETLPEVGGIGLYLKKSGELEAVKHIHIDTRTNRAIWGWNGQTSGTNTPGFGGIPCTFRRGNRSAAIEEIQITLNALGYNCGTPDGDWGDKTDKSFRAWQKAKGLKVDGVYGKGSNKVMGLFNWEH